MNPMHPSRARSASKAVKPCLRCGLVMLLLLLIALPIRAADTGTITATVDKPEQVTSVIAVNRADDKQYKGVLDAKTGKLTITGLPLDQTFDLLIDYGTARLEGVNLKVPRSDYEEEQPLSKDDVETIKKKAKEVNQFEDTIDVMTVSGNIQHAAVILNKLRTKPFYESKPGEVIWRLEVWRFEKPDEAWIKVQDDLFLVLYRQRLQKADFDKKSLTLDPTLGGIKLTEKQTASDLGKVALPGKDAGIKLRPIKVQ